MGWKNIKQAFCPDMDVYTYGADVLIYFNGYDIIRIDTETMKIDTNRTFKTSKIVQDLANRLENAKKTGTLRKLIGTPDAFSKDLPVFTVKGSKVVRELCEEYGYGNPTHSGDKMGCSYFRDRKEAVRHLKETTTQKLKDTFHYSFISSIKKAAKGTWKFAMALWVWLKVRI